MQQPYTQQLCWHLLFHCDGIAFLCFMLHVFHQQICILVNDREHLHAKQNIICSEMKVNSQ